MEDYKKLYDSFYIDFEKELNSNALNFPTSFDMIKKSIDLFEDPNASIDDFAKLIQSEPVIYGKVIRMVNSVGLSPYDKPITGAFKAIQRLGLKKLRCLIYLVSLEQFQHDCRSKKLKMLANVLWRHSIDLGCWGYFLSKETGISDPDSALLSGIMANIGQFFILSRLHNFPSIEENNEILMDIMEKHHKEATKQILDIFKLPSAIIAVYECYSTNYSNWPADDLFDIVMLATIATDINNPFLESIEKAKKKLFEEELSEEERKDFVKLIRSVLDNKKEMFNALTS